MRVDLSTELECSAAAAWAEVQTSSLLLRVIRPIVKIKAVGAPLPIHWRAGSTIRFHCFLFGFVPIGIRTLRFDRIDCFAREISTRESDPLVKRWDHLISIQPLGEDRATYRDVIEIEAGVFTFLVWLWAHWFYRNRQRRWRLIAKTLDRI
jgi:hypothetical protein